MCLNWQSVLKTIIIKKKTWIVLIMFIIVPRYIARKK